jgi:hypothetical protein
MPTAVTKAYEKRALDQFLKTFNEQDILVVEYPDPPDGIIKMKNGQSIWIEVTSVYRNAELAKNLNDPDPTLELHSECLGTEHEYREGLISRILAVSNNKDRKQNYQELTLKFGKGVLIVYIDDPFCTGYDYEQILQDKRCVGIELTNFHSIYLYVRPIYTSDLTIADNKLILDSQTHCQENLLLLTVKRPDL